MATVAVGLPLVVPDSQLRDPLPVSFLKPMDRIPSASTPADEPKEEPWVRIHDVMGPELKAGAANEPPSNDVESAPVLAPGTEVTAERRIDSKTRAGSRPGEFVTTISAGPMHYRDPSTNALRDIDPTLQAPSAGRLRPKGTATNVDVAELKTPDQDTSSDGRRLVVVLVRAERSRHRQGCSLE